MVCKRKSRYGSSGGCGIQRRKSNGDYETVGLNVAADPLMSLAYVGVKGGMVIVSADDPGPISSQTEQDTRRFADFCRIPVFDPSSPEEAYKMIGEAFEYSEKYNTPVLFRPTTVSVTPMLRLITAIALHLKNTRAL